MFTLTPSISGVLPGNTLQAYINLARNPYPSAPGASTNPNGNVLNTAQPALPAMDGAGTMFIPDIGIFASPAVYGLHLYSTVTGNTLSTANGITSCLLATATTTPCGTTTGGAI